jgi:hypothetical protein
MDKLGAKNAADLMRIVMSEETSKRQSMLLSAASA